MTYTGDDLSILVKKHTTGKNVKEKLALSLAVACLPLQAVGHVAWLDGEDRAEVSSLLLAQSVLLDRGNEGRVDCLLQSSALLAHVGLGLLGLGRLLGLLLGSLLGLVAHEVTLGLDALLRLGALERVSGHLGGVNAGDVNLRRCGDDVAAVNAAKRDSVVLQWARDDERAVLRELLQHYCAAATEAASEENGDGAGGDALAESRELRVRALHLLRDLYALLLCNLLGGSFGSH